MKLSVIALDYDGTFTRDDRPNASVRAAVADARQRNVTVVLVTGRILNDVRRTVTRSNGHCLRRAYIATVMDVHEPSAANSRS